ncbi:MAG TPA: polysaccharide deacetylase family protein [Burkholderiaceae bacterium]|nr:polysaccharide deacetylase family protein [Burkholderiaceae bacterium]
MLPVPDPIFPAEVDAARFETMCQWLRTWYNVLPLDEAVSRLKSQALPERACAITFDDGYADNHNVALPILKRHGLPATFFIATGFLDGGRMWNDTVIESVRNSPLAVLDLSELLGPGFESVRVATSTEKAAAVEAIINRIKYQPVAERVSLVNQIAAQARAELPADLMMTSAQVLAMHRAGMQIGAHTVSHPILARLQAQEARAEIAESKRFLEALLDQRVSLFAYPNGKPTADYSTESVAIARDLGFDAAVSTEWGAARSETDLFQIPRFTPWDRAKLRFGARMAANLLRA